MIAGGVSSLFSLAPTKKTLNTAGDITTDHRDVPADPWRLSSKQWWWNIVPLFGSPLLSSDLIEALIAPKLFCPSVWSSQHTYYPSTTLKTHTHTNVASSSRFGFGPSTEKTIPDWANKKGTVFANLLHILAYCILDLVFFPKYFCSGCRELSGGCRREVSRLNLNKGNISQSLWSGVVEEDCLWPHWCCRFFVPIFVVCNIRENILQQILCANQGRCQAPKVVVKRLWFPSEMLAMLPRFLNFRFDSIRPVKASSDSALKIIKSPNKRENTENISNH